MNMTMLRQNNQEVLWPGKDGGGATINELRFLLLAGKRNWYWKAVGVGSVSRAVAFRMVGVVVTDRGVVVG